jgi:acyl-CoA thioester hydrolase
MNSFIYTYTLKVQQKDIDELNHVNNVVYVQWIQDVAVLHWNSATSGIMREKYIWVIVRHEIDYKKPAVLNEKLTIKTWILNAGTVLSDRMVQIYRGEELLVEAKTTWCLLDAITHKPARIQDDIKTLFLP